MDRKRENAVKVRYRPLTGNMMKGIAALSMVTDHIGAVVVKGYVRTNISVLSGGQGEMWQILYDCLRSVGRTAFPLFAFLLAEGFFHTKDRKRYCLRLFLFALLSEIPYDLAISGKVWNPARQNVLFTLLLGFLLLCVMEWANRPGDGRYGRDGAASVCVRAAAVLAACGLAFAGRTDFSYKGVLLVLVFYVFSSYRILAAVAGFCIFSETPMSFPAFLLLPFYNGQRGRRRMRLFYFFYPLHFLVLYGINIVFGWNL